MAPSVVAEILLEELGSPPRRLFAEWSPQPFAAASIGQVHRARLRTGEEVAVKVQYPRIGYTGKSLESRAPADMVVSLAVVA
jgi:aarF domain-containing kinase